MSQYCEQMQNASAAMYTLQRHREILHDYTNEFHKTRNNIEAQLNREQLLGPVKKETGYHFYSSPILIIHFLPNFSFVRGFRTTTNKKNDLYMKENEHIRK